MHGNLIIELYLWNSEGGWGGAKQARGCDMQTPGREGGEILPWGFWALGSDPIPASLRWGLSFYLSASWFAFQSKQVSD